MFKTLLFRRILPVLVASFALCTLLVTALPAQQVRALLTGRPQLVNENIGFDSEAQPYVYDYKATENQTSTHLLVSFEGSAEYTVNGGSAISLTNGVESAVINLGSGTALADRITKIVVTVDGDTNNSYLLRVFRMPKLDSVALRDKSGNAVTHTETQTDSFSFKEEASVGHSLSQLEFEITGSGWFHGWYGHQQISTMGWRDLNMAVYMLFQDGLNTYDFPHYPFRDDPALNGIGWGPNNTYKFEITREPAFGSGTMSSIAIPELSATCAASATECQEISTSPGNYDIRALDSTRSITLNTTFTTGTAEYTVNDGQSQSLTSGVASNTINLGSGTTNAERITTITVTHHGAFDSTYVLRVFRMPKLDSVALRDKSGNAVTHTETQTDSFSFKEEASVGHSLSQLEFEITGSGWFHGWYGHQQISTMGWRDLNMAVYMLFQDGLNTYDFPHYPFRDDPALNGIGWGPNNTYKFEITREPAFGSGTMSSIAIPELSATCAASATECQEISTSPGNYDIRALDSTRSITLNTTFTTGTAEYTVNDGQSQSLTSGVASNTINLGSGTTNAERITTITVTHHGAFDSTYVLRVFRMPKLDSVALRDKSGNAVTHTETQTDSFSFKEEASVGHSLSQLEFEITGSGWFHGWYGHQQISTMGWRDLNMAVYMLFQDGLNTYDFPHYPFRDDPALNGIGWGPNNTYKFEITRAPAFSAPTNNAIPSISGGTTVGSTLNASPGSWSGSNQTYSYNWKRSGSANGSYTDVGSNSPSYNLTEADAGMFIKVAVIATANNLSSNAVFSSAVAVQALATTTTEPESVTTTPRSTTTVPRTNTTIVDGTPSNGDGNSDSGIDALTPAGGTTAPVVTTTPAVSDTPNTTAAPASTTAPTTTEPQKADEITTTTVAVDVNAPIVPEVEVGSAVATINGKVVEVKITTNGNKILFSAGGVNGELGAASSDGSEVQLDADGNLVLTPGDDVSLNLDGFGSEAPVELWMFSIPVKVKDMVADADGKTNGSFATPQGIDSGSHRIVVKGRSPENDEVIIAVGVAVTAVGNSSLMSKLVIPITVAVIVLFIVALTIRLRRRSRLAI